MLMHGPAFDESGKLVERAVPDSDVEAYKAAGYELGPLPETPAVEAEKEEAIAAPDAEPVETHSIRHKVSKK